MKLCFGTFVTVLTCCKGKGKSKQTIIDALMKTIDPNNTYLSIEANTSKESVRDKVFKLRASRLNLPSEFIEIADKINNHDVISRLEDKIIHLFDEDKKIQTIQALLYIIKKDASINSDRVSSFTKYFEKSKGAILKDKEFVLSKFLASVLLYTIITTENNFTGDYKSNKNYHKMIEDKIDTFVDNKAKIKFWNTVEEYNRYVIESGNSTTKKASTDSYVEATNLQQIKDDIANMQSEIENKMELDDILRISNKRISEILKEVDETSNKTKKR